MLSRTGEAAACNYAFNQLRIQNQKVKSKMKTVIERFTRTEDCAGMRRPPEVMIWRSCSATSPENPSPSEKMLSVEDMIIWWWKLFPFTLWLFVLQSILKAQMSLVEWRQFENVSLYIGNVPTKKQQRAAPHVNGPNLTRSSHSRAPLFLLVLLNIFGKILTQLL